MFYKASKTSSYLYQRKNSSSFYFRRAVPQRLRRVINKREIVLSLHTSNKTEAILLHDKLTATVNMIFLATKESDSMNDIFKKVKKLQIDSLKKNADGSIEITGLKTDPNEDTQKAIDFIKAIGLANDTTAIQQQVFEQEAQQKEEQKKKGMRFLEMAEQHLDFEEFNEKTRKQDEAIFQVFAELYDDPYVSDIDHPMMTNFVQTIKNSYPKNAKKFYPKMTAKQIVKLNHDSEKLMSAHSVNKYLGRVGMALTYGVNNGLIAENYAEKKRVKEPERAREKRDAFTDAEVRKILSKKPRKIDTYWLIRIGAYTGMRLGEICQLQPHDIKQENSIWVFDINDEHELKECKTNGAKRIVPIHNKLIEAGFLEFVNSRKNNEFLFAWKYNKTNKWSQYSGRAANNFIQETCRIKNKCFHCFRHTVATKLMNELSDTPKELIVGFIGHAQEGETFGRYGKGFIVEKLKPLSDAIQYE